VVVEAVPNFSEGRDRGLIEQLAAACSSRAHLLDTHSDAVHNRTVVTVAGAELERLLDSLLEAVALARDRIDLRRHAGVHPRVGAADVMPLVPLGETPMDACVDGAHRLGERIWSELGVPVYFYGEAARREEARRLSQIRAGRDAPDLGKGLHPTFGAISVGARLPLVAYNLVLPGAPPREVSALAAAIRESSGGLPGVQALAFDLGAGLVQLSMNLVRLQEVTPGQVLSQAKKLAALHGLQVGAEEVVGLCPAAAADTPACGGRILEARLAAAAAAAGAEACRRRGGEELELLGARLEARAESLGALRIEGDAFLRGAEEAAAIPRVLDRAGVLDSEMSGLLETARLGLRQAVSADVAGRHAARLEALDGWAASPG
jgi:glutamate formiminotransferase